jgi:hypothetical protein
MPLLNYTTSVPVDNTVGEIQKCLATHGADDRGHQDGTARASFSPLCDHAGWPDPL